jgi:hypothetical protein
MCGVRPSSSKADPRRFHLAVGNYAVQGPSGAAPQEGLELNEEAASAIEDSSDDPEVAVPPKNTSDALRKCLTVLTADQCAQETRRTA